MSNDAKAMLFRIWKVQFFLASILQIIYLPLIEWEVLKMNIPSSVNATLHSQYSPQPNVVEKSNSETQSATSLEVAGDKVTLSIEAQRIAATLKNGVEQYALPSWFSEFSPSFATNESC